MNGSTLKSILDATLHADRVERAAQRAALVQRRGGSVQPTELVHAVCLASAVGPTRSIAEARRQWELLSGRCISRGAFDAHFDKPALVETLWDLLRSAMAHANRALRRQWPAPLRMLDDVLLDDGSRMRLRKSAAEKFPATDEGTAGMKLMTRMSLAEGSLCDATVDAARTHDHALRFKTPFKRGTLYLRDLGFYDHSEFAAFDEASASFVSRWKDGVNAVVKGHAEGLVLPAALAQGQPLERSDVLGRTSDIDATLRLDSGKTVAVRLVRVRLVLVDKRGAETGELDRWYVTNLPRASWTADAISAAYRLRWLIERAFRRMKHGARADHLQTSRETAAMALLAAALLVSVLAERIHHALAREFGLKNVSVDRCELAVLSALHRIVMLWKEPRHKGTLSYESIARFITHESRHPNRSQPHLVDEVFATIEAST
jgi:IS4 transposase